MLRCLAGRSSSLGPRLCSRLLSPAGLTPPPCTVRTSPPGPRLCDLLLLGTQLRLAFTAVFGWLPGYGCAAYDGLRLYARDYPCRDPDNRAPDTVLCMHGLTRNSADFAGLADHLSESTLPKLP